MLASLHVSATTMQRVARVVTWLVPYVLMGLTAAVGFGFRWVSSRAGREEMSGEIAKAKSAAQAAQNLSTHCSSLLDGEHGQIAQARAAWGEVVALHAELLIYREYGKLAARERNELIDDAKEFYAKQYKAELDRTATDAASAAARTLAQRFRPAGARR